MPVGKVFDAGQNQVLFSPVSNYYRGKAIRTQQATAEKALGQMDDKLALEKRQVDLSERRLENQEELLQLNIDKYEDDVGREKASSDSFDLWHIVSNINEKFNAGNKTKEEQDALLAEALPQFTDYANNLNDGDAKASLLEKLQNGLTAEEYQSVIPAAEMAAKKYGHIGQDKLTTVAKGADVINSRGEVVYQNIDEALTGDNGKPLAAEVKTGMVFELLTKGTFKGNPVDDATRDALLDSLDVQRGAKGSITISLENAQDYADDIVNRTEIGENRFGWDNEGFNDRLAMSLMRLAKDGRYGGAELEQRALIDALGADYDELLEQTEIEDADGNKPTMDELVEALAELVLD